MSPREARGLRRSSGDDNIVPLIATSVDQGDLFLHPTKPVAPKLELVARIATPTLTAISASGAIQAKLQGIAASNSTSMAAAPCNSRPQAPRTS